MTLEERVEVLEAEVAYLRAELGLSVELTRVADAMKLGMWPCVARAALVLHDANGRVLSSQQILDAVPPLDRSIERGTLDMVRLLMSKVRKVLGADAVSTAWGLGGYRMTSVGSARLLAALERPA